MLALFAGTTMDSGVRLQRYIIQEWGDIYGIKLFNSGVVATLVAVAACLLPAFGAGVWRWRLLWRRWNDNLAIIRSDESDSCQSYAVGYNCNADQDGPAILLHYDSDDFHSHHFIFGRDDSIARFLQCWELPTGGAGLYRAGGKRSGHAGSCVGGF